MYDGDVPIVILIVLCFTVELTVVLTEQTKRSNK